MKRIIMLGLIVLFSSATIAQSVSPQVISSAGNSSLLNSISIEWTLGEIAITTLRGPSHMITQGFHQPKYVITTIGEPLSDAEAISVYPNPVSDLLKMDMIFNREKTVYVRLTDSGGKVIWNTKYVGQQIIESLSMKNYPAGNYLLNFSINGGKSHQTYKIQKTN